MPPSPSCSTSPTPRRTIRAWRPSASRTFTGREDIELPRNFLPEHPIDNGNLRGRDEMLAGFPRTPDEVRRHIAAYYGMISEVDAQIGRVLDTVEQSGQAENTYIIWAGDNGLAVGQHGLFGKQNMYDHSLRVPMVISGPGIAGGRKVDGMCHVMDLCPTICDLAGVPRAAGARCPEPQARPGEPARSVAQRGDRRLPALPARHPHGPVEADSLQRRGQEGHAVVRPA